MALHLLFFCDICNRQADLQRAPAPAREEDRRRDLKDALALPPDWLVMEIQMDLPSGFPRATPAAVHELTWRGRFVVCPDCGLGQKTINPWPLYQAWLSGQGPFLDEPEQPQWQPWEPLPRPPTAPFTRVSAQDAIDGFLQKFVEAKPADRADVICRSFQDTELVQACILYGGIEAAMIDRWGAGPLPEPIARAFSTKELPHPTTEHLAWNVYQLGMMMNALPMELLKVTPSVGDGYMPGPGWLTWEETTKASEAPTEAPAGAPPTESTP